MEEKLSDEYVGELHGIAEDFLLARDILDQCEVNWRKLRVAKNNWERHKEWRRNLKLSGL